MPPRRNWTTTFWRGTVGNVVEALGVVAFRASPVWVLAALSDVCGLGRHLIPEIAASLKQQGLLDDSADFSSVDQLLDGLERTSGRVAQSINTPPLDVPALREEWRALRAEARGLAPDRLPTGESLIGLWTQLKAESARQDTSVFDTSSMLALSAVRSAPQGARWLGASAVVGATRTGQVLAASLIEQYRDRLRDIQEAGYAEYATRQLRPYVRAAASQFAPGKPTLTARLLDRFTRKST